MKNIKKWWLLKFRNKVIKELDLTSYKVTFRRFTTEIETKGGNMKLTLSSSERLSAFMFNNLSEGNVTLIDWCCFQTYRFISLFASNITLVKDIDKAFMSYYKRIEKEISTLVESTSEDDEQIASEVIKANIKVAKMNKKERKAHKEAIRKVITNEEE